jgi:hypothetical protein
MKTATRSQLAGKKPPPSGPIDAATLIGALKGKLKTQVANVLAAAPPPPLPQPHPEQPAPAKPKPNQNGNETEP